MKLPSHHHFAFSFISLVGLSLGLGLAGSALAEEYRTFTSADGRELVAKVVRVAGDDAVLQRKSDGQQFTLKKENLSEADQDWLDQWEAPEPEVGVTIDDAAEDAELHRSLYPRTRNAIRTRIDEIMNRPTPKGMDERMTQAVNTLNAYRYLSGVGDEVTLDPEKNDRAAQAAKACENHGSLSHDIGAFTEACNLHQGISTMQKSVIGYIDDPGAGNREQRGHRRWCLNPPLGKVGFGQSAGFHAMDCMDRSARSRARDSWGYPGKGFFPLDHLHGNGWSLYLTETAPEAKSLTVEVWRLAARPDKPLGATAEPLGEKIGVPWVSTYLNAINFEPSIPREPGIYWVRIHGGGVREQYLVELFES